MQSFQMITEVIISKKVALPSSEFQYFFGSSLLTGFLNSVSDRSIMNIFPSGNIKSCHSIKAHYENSVTCF